MVDVGHTPTILVVEDDPNMVEIITFLLEDEGYQVLQATGAEVALSLLEQHKVDLIISDVMMPGMSGFDFYERLHVHPEWSQIPFIFLTAKSQRADVRRGMGLGADDYLTKPFEPEELLSAITVRLQRAAAARSVIDRASADLQEMIIRTLTHEFRTPLALVVGYTDLLESSGQEMGEDDFQTILQGLHSGSERLMVLVEDFLLLSRLRSGYIARQVEKHPQEAIDPDSVVQSVVARLKAEAGARNVSLSVHPGSAGLAVAVGQRDLAEIARRLIDNAIKFSKPCGGRVEVFTRPDGGFWMLEVIDDGIGIADESLPHVFEAFRQVDRGKMEQQGAGVGLTVVQGLAEVYGGWATAASTLGEGSTFSVWLPLATT
jgi:two-component system sensor histidine kinase/response regulator